MSVKNTCKDCPHKENDCQFFQTFFTRNWMPNDIAK